MNTGNFRRPSILDAARTGLTFGAVRDTLRDYRALFDEERGADAAQRRNASMRLVNQYYDLVTDFYEYGWGQSFHFAPRRAGETFGESIKRHEHYLALRLGLGPGDRVIDVGCGVGGPMREIAALSGARIVGINNNAYQIARGTRHNAAAGLADRCRFEQADFNTLPLADGSMTAAYAIEATCHAADRVLVFSEVHRVLAPGGLFAGYEWCITDRYDAADPEHRRIIRAIEEGDALPELQPPHVVDSALRAAGFELLDARDLAGDGSPETPWYHPLTGRQLTPKTVGRTRWGRKVTRAGVAVLERLGVAPKGSGQVSELLNMAADALVEGGERGIFTPMYFFLARKPG